MSHRVGAIPFIVEDGDVKLLMVTSLKRGRWVFPKGTLKKVRANSKAVDAKLLKKLVSKVRFCLICR